MFVGVGVGVAVSVGARVGVLVGVSVGVFADVGIAVSVAVAWGLIRMTRGVAVDLIGKRPAIGRESVAESGVAN